MENKDTHNADAIQFVKETFEWALRNRIVKTQKEFAKKVGISPTSMSTYMSGVQKGHMSGKCSAKKVRAWLESNFKGEMGINVEDYKKGFVDAMRRDDAVNWAQFRAEAALRIYCTLQTALTQRGGAWIKSSEDLIEASVAEENTLLIILTNVDK